MNINQLSRVTPSAADLMALWSTANGETSACSLTQLATLLASLTTAADDKVTQYAAPSASGFTVTLVDDSDSKWLVLTPTAGFAAGTIKLPAVANAVDKQEILVNCTQIVTALTINGNGATVTGGPTALAANDFFRLRFDAVMDVWYRVG